MNVTREVVTDLLPIYFSDEASADTKVLVEQYFRQDPDFERIARRAAMPLETLRAAVPIAASSSLSQNSGLKRWIDAGRRSRRVAILVVLPCGSRRYCRSHAPLRSSQIHKLFPLFAKISLDKSLS
jgi:hypothetical protein